MRELAIVTVFVLGTGCGALGQNAGSALALVGPAAVDVLTSLARERWGSDAEPSDAGCVPADVHTAERYGDDYGDWVWAVCRAKVSQ